MFLRGVLAACLFGSLTAVAVAKSKPKPKPKLPVKVTKAKAKPQAKTPAPLRAPTAQKKSKAPQPVKVEAVPTPAPSIAPEPMVSAQSSRYLKEFSSGFGALAIGIPGVAVHAQMRFLSSKKRPLYFGIDGIFALFDAPNRFLSILPGVWYDFIIRPQPLANLTFGLLAGPTFSKGLPVPDQSFGAFGEVAIGWELDDLTSVRGQFRPGIVGGRFAYNMGLMMGFRFR